jgi:hypothetical protein
MRDMVKNGRTDEDDREENPESDDAPIVVAPNSECNSKGVDECSMNFGDFRIGDEYDVLDINNRWCEAAVSPYIQSLIL